MALWLSNFSLICCVVCSGKGVIRVDDEAGRDEAAGLPIPEFNNLWAAGSAQQVKWFLMQHRFGRF